MFSYTKNKRRITVSATTVTDVPHSLAVPIVPKIRIKVKEFACETRIVLVTLLRKSTVNPDLLLSSHLLLLR